MPTGVRVVDDFMEDVEKGEDTVTQTNPTSVNTSEDVMIIDVDEEEKRKPTDDSDDEEDEVVSTYEVFLSHTLQKDLHVLQFPMRPMTRPYDFKSLKAMTYKPNHRKLDLTFEVNKHTEHFNPNFADSDSTFQLTSNVVPMKTNYAVGIIRGTQLHITPLQSMLQLRPSTEKHAEVASTGKEKVSKAKVKKEEEGGAPPKPAQIIASSFRTQADEKERQKTWSYIKQQETEERAITLEHKVKLESDAIIQQLFDTYGEDIAFDLSREKYLDTLVPYREEVDIRAKEGQDHAPIPVSLESVKKLDPKHQVQLVMFGGKVLPFSRIKSLVSVKSDEELIPMLENVAVLIRGVWVIKSEFNEQFTLDKDAPIKHPRLAAVRDYLLYLFYEYGTVNRNEFALETKISAEKAHRLLSEIGVVKLHEGEETYGGDWILKVPEDHTFNNRKPEVYLRQEEEWKERVHAAKQSKLTDFNQSGAQSGTLQSRARDVEEDVKAWVQKMLNNFGVLKKEGFKALLVREKKLKDVAEKVIDKVINDETVKFKDDGTLMARTTGSVDNDKFRMLLINNLLKKQDIVTRNECMAAVNTGITGKQMVMANYTTIITQLAVAQSGGSYKVRTGDEYKDVLVKDRREPAKKKATPQPSASTEQAGPK